ncbi:response regulator [Cohnella soli]|uniref:histidine kinase n=1 Tax=Cohnella soli TaxID=425005 RepID=A0ABW0HVX5_9BACL
MILRDIRFNIRSKMALGFVLIICCLGAFIFVVHERISSLQEEVRTITSHDLEVFNLITSIRYNAMNMETSQRGYIITGDEGYLEPYTKSKTEWLANYNTLYDNVSDDPSSRKELEEIKVAIENWINTIGEPAITLRRENKMDEVITFFNEVISKQDIESLRGKLEDLRQKEIQSTKDQILQLQNRNDILIFSLYTMLFLVSVAAFIIVFFVSGTIVKTIKQVVKTITDIASSGGDLSARIHVESQDEIKDLADATNNLLENINVQNRIQTKVAEVANMSQGINDLNTLADSFLSKLAPTINASYGLFYILREYADEKRLVKIGSYAASDDKTGVTSFRMGEGLIGQAALDNRTFLLNSTIDHPISIKSSLGDIQPHSILVVPVEFEGKVVAVIEFASLESFTSEHLKLLEQIEIHFGDVINNVASRMEVERLLSESQVLTEKLQAQTEALQAQSEELQMQQEELLMTTEHLEKQNLFASQKTKELEQAREELFTYSEQLKQSSQYKSNFLANMSHELRTPLNSILILSQILLENENDTLSHEEEEYAKVIHSSGNDLLTLIDDILDLSKIEAGKMLLTWDEVNVSEIPDHMRLMFNPVAKKKDLAFDVIVHEDVSPILRTDGQRLLQILKNLLSNAFKFTNKGTVTLEIQNADPEHVRKYLPSKMSDTVLAISVTDTGIGIPSSKQQVIFEAFHQADGKTNRQYGGTGLGLSICSEFARLLGGSIVLESKDQQGSTFTLYIPSYSDKEKEKLVSLPFHQEAAPAFESEAPSSTSDASLFKGKKVLLVEDDTRNVLALVKALENKEFIVTVANNGKHCLEIIQQNSDYDVVLMDIMMPIMDGFETMRAIRQHKAMKEIPIIALTAKAMMSDREKCIEAGASDYISKPLQMEQLFSLLRVWLTKQIGN